MRIEAAEAAEKVRIAAAEAAEKARIEAAAVAESREDVLRDMIVRLECEVRRLKGAAGSDGDRNKLVLNVSFKCNGWMTIDPSWFSIFD